MDFVYAHETVYSLSLAIPTVNKDNKVENWELKVHFSCDHPDHADCINADFGTTVDVSALDKTPEEFTKDELLSLLDIDHYCVVFDSMYGSLTVPPVNVLTRVDDFDLDSLS